MKKVYLKVLTHSVNPSILTQKIGIKPDRVIIKGTQINEKGGKYGYNGFIINIDVSKYENNSFIFEIENIIEKIGNTNNVEIKLYIELNIDNNLYGTSINSCILKFLGENEINLEII